MSFLNPDYIKPKSPYKITVPDNEQLALKITEIVSKITAIVGSTLGPNGQTILIEKTDPGLPPFHTKDGVTVINNMCEYDEVKQAILETFRDAAVKTVESAGDGTTTATILAGSILEKMNKYLKNDRKISKQFAAREILKYLNQEIIPYIEKSSLKVDHNNSSTLLTKVAKVSTNGDEELTKIIIEAFELIGDSGHITIVEEPGESGFELVKTDGYPFDKGFEQSLGIFSNEFINDHDSNRVVLDNPHFLLIDGKVLELNPLVPFLNMVEQEVISGRMSPNLVIMAHQFSQEVVAKLAQWWKVDGALKILPCGTPMDMLVNSQYDFLRDMAAFTGGKIFNPLNNPIHNAVVADLGQPSVSFECQRYRSIVHGTGNEETVLVRVKELLSQSKQPSTTKLAFSILEERAGRLSGGIAKLIIRSISEAQGRETRDRAEDAICAIRGAIKHGVLPGGCRILLNLSLMAEESTSKIVKEVIAPALREPLFRLLLNCGLNAEEIAEVVDTLIANPGQVYDAAKSEFGLPLELDLLDSTPAVLEAVRTAVSIAASLSTLGGVIVHPRNPALDMAESMSFHSKMQEINAASGDIDE